MGISDTMNCGGVDFLMNRESLDAVSLCLLSNERTGWLIPIVPLEVFISLGLFDNLLWIIDAVPILAIFPASFLAGGISLA